MGKCKNARQKARVGTVEEVEKDGKSRGRDLRGASQGQNWRNRGREAFYVESLTTHHHGAGRKCTVVAACPEVAMALASRSCLHPLPGSEAAASPPVPHKNVTHVERSSLAA